MDSRDWTRRDLLRAGTGLGIASVAGCQGLFQRRSTRSAPVVADRPDAIYTPSHVEGMQMIGAKRAGDRMVGLLYSYAHRFWLITGSNRQRVENRGDVHLMVTVWDPDTGTVLPVGSGVGVAVEKDGEPVADRNQWTMLSQNMGFHYGDNFFLDGDGTYAVTVTAPPLSIDRVGGFADRFEESATATFEWSYSEAKRNEIRYETLDAAGEPGALEPMEMDVPLSFAPTSDEVPHDVAGEAESGDVTFLATYRAADDGDYLAVVPRTAYNGYVLPLLSLSATLARDGETVYDDVLTAAIGPDLGYHYAAAVDAVESGDELTVTVDASTQASRHEGYETAFFDLPDASLTVS